jgi:hypothetical protein
MRMSPRARLTVPDARTSTRWRRSNRAAAKTNGSPRTLVMRTIPVITPMLKMAR